MIINLAGERRQTLGVPRPLKAQRCAVDFAVRHVQVPEEFGCRLLVCPVTADHCVRQPSSGGEDRPYVMLTEGCDSRVAFRISDPSK